MFLNTATLLDFRSSQNMLQWLNYTNKIVRTNPEFGPNSRIWNIQNFLKELADLQIFLSHFDRIESRIV